MVEELTQISTRGPVIKLLQSLLYFYFSLSSELCEPLFLAKQQFAYQKMTTSKMSREREEKSKL